MNDIKSNWLDRAAGWLSPRWEAERLAYRQWSAAYRGGIQTRVDRPWASPAHGITTQSILEISRLSQMLQRARKVDADNAIGHGILNRLVDNVVGEGFTLQARTESKDFNRVVEERWREFWESPEVTGLFSGAELERITYREYERDGLGGGWLLVDNGGRSRLQLIRGDQITTPDTKGSIDPGTRGKIYDGVEVNEKQRPLAFHFVQGDEYGKRKWTRIPADRFIYMPRIKRANQVRGETCFAQVFPYLDQLDGYVDAVVTAARMAAIFGLIFKQGSPAQAVNALSLTLPNSNGDQKKAITLENGLVKYVGRDDEVAQVQASQPMAQTPDFIRAMLRLIGLPMDMPLELILMDFSEPNFAAVRGALISFYRAMRPRQAKMAGWLSRTYRWWLSRELKSDDALARSAPRQNELAHEFLARGWASHDPINDAQTAMLELDIGLTSLPRLLKARGIDPDELMAERVADMKTRELAGLPQLHSNLSRDPQPETPDENTDADRSQRD